MALLSKLAAQLRSISFYCMEVHGIDRVKTEKT